MNDLCSEREIDPVHSADDANVVIRSARECLEEQEHRQALGHLIRAIELGYPTHLIRRELVEAAQAVQKDGSILIPIPEGEFLMGSRDDDPAADGDEKPQHPHRLPSYRIGLHPVTNAQYKRFVDAMGHAPPKADYGTPIWRGNEFPSQMAHHPVVWVTWEDAQAYCEWAGLRLPTEAEWEKAARGDNGRQYPWGHEWDRNRCRCMESHMTKGTCSVWDNAEGRSPYGLYNMAGNVWEWCADWYDPDVYQRYSRGDLSPPQRGVARVLRGGFWGDAASSVRATSRGRYRPEATNGLHGFRCALSSD